MEFLFKDRLKALDYEEMNFSLKYLLVNENNIHMDVPGTCPGAS